MLELELSRSQIEKLPNTDDGSFTQPDDIVELELSRSHNEKITNIYDGSLAKPGDIVDLELSRNGEIFEEVEYWIKDLFLTNSDKMEIISNKKTHLESYGSNRHFVKTQIRKFDWRLSVDRKGPYKT